jgi:hypothetical protein
MKIKFCCVDDCGAVAVGISRWNPADKPAEDHCRPHYISEVMGEPVLAEVVGPCLITDSVSQEGVDRGGVVRLDPRQVNIAQLVYAGHVEVRPVKGARAAAERAAAKAANAEG